MKQPLKAEKMSFKMSGIESGILRFEVQKQFFTINQKHPFFYFKNENFFISNTTL